ncbi:MAG: IS1 family transposase [Symbiopectobacterium sp.]
MHLSSRSKKTRRKLLKLFSGFRVAFWCTDGYRAYNTNSQKQNTLLANCIHSMCERENLMLRNRLKRLNRKTLGYSTSSECTIGSSALTSNASITFDAVSTY